MWLIYFISLTAGRNEINATIVAACIPTIQPLVASFELTRRTKGHRRSGSTAERIGLGNLSAAYAGKRNGSKMLPAQLLNRGSIQRTVEVFITSDACHF